MLETPVPSGGEAARFRRDGSLSVDLSPMEAQRQPWLHHLDAAGEIEYDGTLAKKTESIFGFGEERDYYHYVVRLADQRLRFYTGFEREREEE